MRMLFEFLTDVKQRCDRVDDLAWGYTGTADYERHSGGGLVKRVFPDLPMLHIHLSCQQHSSELRAEKYE